MTNIATRIGTKLSLFLVDLAETTKLFFSTLFLSLTSPPKWRHISSQMFSMGVMSLPVVLVTGAFVGMVLAAQSYYVLHKISMESATGPLVSLSMTNELGPVITAIVLSGRVGAAMAAELGTMKVTEQIDALRAMATSPTRYLVVPRFISGLVMVPLLTAFATSIGILGAYLVAVPLKKVNATFFLNNMYRWTNPEDVRTGLIKSVVFGAIIVIVACRRGFTAEGGAKGVGRAATQTVVISCIAILIVDFFLDMLLLY
ncbi:ABC transporter permease [bacterium]|nr:ABC transporter permease [bacterium]